jgi:hypothetical protein
MAKRHQEARPQRLHENKHHIMHDRATHNGNMNNYWIRNRLGLIVLMDVGVHRELHEATPTVPPLSMHMAQAVRSQLHPQSNPFKAIDEFRRAVEVAQDYSRMHRVEIESADLTMQAIEAQLPYLREGYVHERS